MPVPERLIFLHGLEGTSQGVKATLLRGLFPHILTPDFHGGLPERMAALQAIIQQEQGWTLIGSSFGGLMSALFSARRPHQVDRQILLAPALVWPDFASSPPAPVDTPTVIYHGKYDEVVPLEPVQRLARQVFRTLDFHIVDDDHGLYKTVHALDWEDLLGQNSA